MKLHFLQHVDFEGPAYIASWAAENNHALSGTKVFNGEPLPPADSIDKLIVLGGPMSVNEDDRFPWLTAEKRFIEAAIAQEKTILGICLGAQLIADTLGAKVARNKFKEIGWFPVRMTMQEREHRAFVDFPNEFAAFHWHGDTFDIPIGADLAATSEACENQAFVYGNNVIGLQFHLEITAQSIESLVTNCGHELVEGDFIQSREKLPASSSEISQANAHMNVFLNRLCFD